MRLVVLQLSIEITIYPSIECDHVSFMPEEEVHRSTSQASQAGNVADSEA
jgi:hypothetical protein